MQLPAGSVVADVGCGTGRHSVRLADRGFRVIGIDPLPRELGPDIEFRLGVAEKLPLDDDSVDLVWCRDVLVHAPDLDAAYREFARVLRSGGRVLVYQMFAGDLLEPREAEWLFPTMAVVPETTDPARTDAAIAASGLRLDERIVLGTEWGEWRQERDGEPGRRLLHAARLLRDPERYTGRFGERAVELMLGDCLWHVYAMIGKLERRIFLLTAA
jgi:SAM-dependent methyltransferase